MKTSMEFLGSYEHRNHMLKTSTEFFFIIKSHRRGLEKTSMEFLKSHAHRNHLSKTSTEFFSHGLESCTEQLPATKTSIELFFH